MTNQKIRTALEKAGMRQWELAELLGVSEGNFSRRMRRELPAAEQKRICSLIQKHAQEAAKNEQK